jgi:superfamily I DNA/RNA helicase
MKNSVYQEAIYEWIRNGRGDGVVNAVAGSGKTTTLVEASKHLHTSNALFLAFNKSIVEELKLRLGEGVECKTLNSLGHSALMKVLGRRLRLDNDKYGDLLQRAINDQIPNLSGDKFGEVIRATKALLSYAMSSMSKTDDASLAELAYYYGLDLPNRTVDESQLFNIIRMALTTGEAMAHERGIIAFDDQVYLPVKWNLKPRQADFIMVDEAQDLSRAKLELVLSARAPGGRMLFVGDPRQSIYGFAGADARSFDNIIERTQATVMPLSVCYRCPTSVIEHAQTIVPGIEAAPDAKAGAVITIKESELPGIVGSGDLILCRLTAPLVKLCIELIGARIPARVRGRDIGKALLSIAKEALGKRPWSDFNIALSEYEAYRTEVLLARKHPEAQISSLNDKLAGIRACYDGFSNVKSMSEFVAAVEALFSDKDAMIDLSTIHRAKGLQAQRVFIIKPKKLPLVWKNQQPWEAEQEINLRYVALTRAQSELYFVTEPPKAHEEVAA